MKARMIEFGKGVALANAIHAILKRDDGNATLILSGGVNLPTDIAYDDIVTSVTGALEASPLTEMVPDLATAMAQLKERLETPDPNTGGDSTAIAKAGKRN